jgi:hypothetical protein|tara:strand:- start:1641 stop:2360 length:720 start_codon:yes stop_codon:yes gene_type:complete
MNDLSFKEIWETLHNVDVSKHTEEKMKLTYLSWSRAWMLLMEHYPQAEYTFVDYNELPYRVLPDGTAEVITKVKIEGHIRSMALPIMDYKNNAVVNPNARQVNDNRMRCLVKNLAMFGLGMSVFAVWSDHLPSEEKDEQPKDKKAPTKKKAKKAEPKAKVIGETFDEAWADIFLEATEKLIVLQDTRELLTGFYKANKEAIGRLKSNFPEHKDRLDKTFKDHADSLAEDSKTNSQDNKE